MKKIEHSSQQLHSECSYEMKNNGRRENNGKNKPNEENKE